jgi:hypothetical protein
VSSPGGFARRYETHILGDGFYFFLDLPIGDYVLTGHDEDGNEIQGQRVSIKPADGTGPLGVNVSASRKLDTEEEPPPATKTATAPARRRRASRRGTATNRDGPE